ncbi:MAG: hypothetical protein V4712_15210 [Pseudomonadota bacterium]
MRPDPKMVAADRGERLLEQGSGQLGMFGPEGEVIDPAKRAGPGRPVGAGNKLKSRLKDYLTAKGYRDPAEHLALLAGLDRRDKHPLHVAAEIAAVLGEDVMAVAREMRQATEALLPYWHAKLTPDVSVTTPAVNILMQGAGGMVGIDLGDAGDDPFAPLDVRIGLIGDIEQNQGVSDGPETEQASE